jgi:hypothetical protein
MIWMFILGVLVIGLVLLLAHEIWSDWNMLDNEKDMD